MCFYFSDEQDEGSIKTFVYHQDTKNLHPGTLSPLPTQFFEPKQIHQQFIYNKYTYEISLLESVSKEVEVKEKEKNSLLQRIEDIQKKVGSEIKDVDKLFANVE
ncbi:hypothetical protein M9Y10_008628 [Tritrichomonas musculus]|uniref:Uncharacterized protein n=1 Tax=Tritrichomonas musculus TaxID=1915356 RepID=A0ABR2IYZ0_9EUKA